MTEPSVRLRGSSGGLRLVVDPGVAEPAIAREIASILGRSGRLSGPAEITVELPGRQLTPSLAELTCKAVAAVSQDLRVRTITTAPARERSRQARPLALKAGAVVHRSGLRAGQEITSDGDLVIMGDVHSGARVTAAGDVVVLGRLEGIAHAGALGDDRRIVYAARFVPPQVRIADLIALSPEESDSEDPEWAHVEEGRIVVETWHSTSVPLPTGTRTTSALP